MHIVLDMRNPAPIYEQLAGSIREHINRGTLKPGDMLPTVRQLADDLGVNLNTVARAYRELADEELLSVRQGRGAEVAGTRARFGREEKETLRRKLREIVNVAVSLGLTRDDVCEMVDSEVARLRGGAR